MKSRKLQIAIFCLVALATLCVSSNAKADTWNKATKLTFSQPGGSIGNGLTIRYVLVPAHGQSLESKHRPGLECRSHQVD